MNKTKHFGPKGFLFNDEDPPVFEPRKAPHRDSRERKRDDLPGWKNQRRQANRRQSHEA
jgi:hypothetical protein